MIGIPLGLLYSNAGEWLIHKHVLHGLGRNRRSFWSFHWHEHHARSRKNDMFDEQYTGTLLGWSPQTQELVALLGLAAAHVPLLPVAPFFASTVLWSMLRYYRMHKRCHLDTDWGRAKMPWHVDHHLGRDQDLNWCVTHPFFDHLMGTRQAYAYGDGPPREAGLPADELPMLQAALARLLAPARRRAEEARAGAEHAPL